MGEVCIGCETARVREHWLTIHDDGTHESAFSEAMAGRSLYCQACYDALDEPTGGENEPMSEGVGL